MGTGNFRLAATSVRWVMFASRPAPWRGSLPRPADIAAQLCAYGVARTRDLRRDRHNPVLTGRTQMKAELGDMAWRLLADVSARR
jgi:hypothetical protein